MSEATPLERRLDAFDRFVYRNRHIAGPPALAVLLLGGAAAGHATNLSWLVTVLAGVAFVLGLDTVADLPTLREKLYALACWCAAAGWTVVTAWTGVHMVLVVALALLVVVLGVPWAHHRRVRRGVDVDRTIAAWGDGGAVGLRGTHVRGKKAGDGWFSFKLVADEPGTYTLDDFEQRAARIAARFGRRKKDVTFKKDGGEGEIEVVIRDQERDTVASDDDPTEAVSIVGGFRVGSTDAGDPIEQAVYLEGRGAVHGAAVGATGSGKSSLINKVAERAARADDAVLWIVDLSYGAKELRGWAPVCDWFAYTVEHVEDMLVALAAICESRGSGEGRLHTPSAAEPAIVVEIDEGASVWAPELLPADSDMAARKHASRVAQARRDRAGELLRLARKYGVSVHQATQYGNQDALGGPAAKQQLAAGFASVFYSGKNTDGHLLIPAGHNVRCSEFPQSAPGTLATKGPTIDGVVQGRVDWTSDERRDTVVDHWRDKQPELEGTARAAGGNAYARRNRTAPGDSPHTTSGDTGGDTGGDGGESAGHRVPTPDFTATASRASATVTPLQPAPSGATVPGRLSPGESRALVLSTLAEFPEPAYPAQIAEACGRGKDLVGMRLRQLAEEGKVARIRGGRWHTVPAPAE